MTIAEIHRLFLECNSISTDTRKIENNSMFVALKGENFDANTFAEEALAKGAKYVIVDNPKYTTGDKTILVENSLLFNRAPAGRHYFKSLTSLMNVSSSKKF